MDIIHGIATQVPRAPACATPRPLRAFRAEYGKAARAGCWSAQKERKRGSYADSSRAGRRRRDVRTRRGSSTAANQAAGYR